ncbi:F0F1 ATP synthase subunit epsilon [Corynebacterium pseudodiphtheriticum]|jgi:ATP synthase F1, epsilon subunit|uniref:ATP synthase epsilon chain n=1 Tax=Corynebacterium pseudodiphtheriticum TaxID=37637 RepID=A0AAP4F7G8_9CORY|nr:MULTISPECIES: F0F1 ATP synthase subunit epsilon [Corynebacterium]ERJ45247.1 F0F1 ATP synthase subunit epsilon [Corynebacterium pseudodiphtheriticum 090104]ERS38700.1 ATP synthase F1, epsilon subunit [Corynebacterium sp. KPL1995]ERS71220.1 ATP synthase F1, epsilon subunit [Corynebacterium sp. KPL1989]MCG7252403.1 F0F1 ATP synthase subunit epsilon [Corynebacterium pseudodiphtheriticum]MDC7067386.1 F0F1 ATP synthase subunit epsilon [Corynebacterium pseudodiphtheriticum]
MAEFTVELVAVDRKLWSGQATMVTAETTDGELGVLPGHQPLLGQLLDNGVVTITGANGDRVVFGVQGGFLSVSKEKVTVLADWAITSEEWDSSTVEEYETSDDEYVRAHGITARRAQRRAELI